MLENVILLVVLLHDKYGMSRFNVKEQFEPHGEAISFGLPLIIVCVAELLRKGGPTRAKGDMTLRVESAVRALSRI